MAGLFESCLNPISQLGSTIAVPGGSGSVPGLGQLFPCCFGLPYIPAHALYLDTSHMYLLYLTPVCSLRPQEPPLGGIILWAKANRLVRSYPHLEAKFQIILAQGKTYVQGGKSKYTCIHVCIIYIMQVSNFICEAFFEASFLVQPAE